MERHFELSRHGGYGNCFATVKVLNCLNLGMNLKEISAIKERLKQLEAERAKLENRLVELQTMCASEEAEPHTKGLVTNLVKIQARVMSYPAEQVESCYPGFGTGHRKLTTGLLQPCQARSGTLFFHRPF